MKILIVTGKLASDVVKSNVKNSKHQVDVYTVNTPIAAFLTPERIAKEIEGLNYDMVIIPGLVKGNAKKITEKTNIPAYKGPTDAADLGILLDIINKVKLSPKKPANKLIEEEQKKRALNFIKKFEKNEKIRKELLKKDENILVGNLPVGRDFPMRVLAEIANAPSLTKNELKRKVDYFIKNGADMIDIGMIAGKDYSDKIPTLIEIVRKRARKVPISIDTLNVNEIETAIKCGIDLVLSLDHGNYKDVLPLLEDNNIPAVILPTNYTEGWVPEKPEERVKSLENLKKKCKDIDIIADPILDPINSKSIVDSILACKLYADRNPDPLFFGVGNVTELLDADSVGVNALLAGIGMELGASILFTPEESEKTRGSVYELALSSIIMFLAKKRKSIPKDLGVNLLIFKDKRRYEMIDENVDVPVIKAKGMKKFIPDKAGSFKISVKDDHIEVIHYKSGKPTVKFVGKNSKKIYEEIIKRGLVSRLEHAAYLGSELQKAEIALITGKSYVQDKDLFKKPLDLREKR